MVSTTPARYERALRELSESFAQAEALASLLDYFVGLLNGRPPDPEGPPLELYPSAGQVRRALQRRAKAVEAVLEEWAALPGEAQEGLPAPQEAAEGVEGAWG
jgi:hypothetical protein